MVDVGGIFKAMTGGVGGCTLEVRLQPPSNNENVVPMDHLPSWKLHKNPFWRVTHPHGNQLTQPAMMQQQPSYYDANNSTGQQIDNNMTVAAAAVGSSPPPNVYFAYEATQDVEGQVIVRVMPGKKQEHLGIKVLFIGRIDMSQGVHEGRPHYDFISVSKELLPPGMLYRPEMVLPFKFKNMDKELESYYGRNVSVRYIVKVVMERKFMPPLVKEAEVYVQILGTPPPEDEQIALEVGIEDCLHIEFSYERRHYHLRDTIHGKIHFLLVRIKIKHMEVAVLRREISGEGVAAAAAAEAGSGAAGMNDNTNDAANNIFTETQTLVKYEIMDGAPVKGEVIPVRLSLQGLPADLTPTYTSVNNRFSVKYFINLVLVDEDDRRYFKQQEIILWRKELG